MRADSTARSEERTPRTRYVRRYRVGDVSSLKGGVRSGIDLRRGIAFALEHARKGDAKILVVRRELEAMLEVSLGGGIFTGAGTHHSRHQQGIHVIGRCF